MRGGVDIDKITEIRYDEHIVAASRLDNITKLILCGRILQLPMVSRKVTTKESCESQETSLTLVDEPSNPHSNGLGCLNERMLVAVMPLSQNPIAFRHGRGSNSDKPALASRDRW